MSFKRKMMRRRMKMFYGTNKISSYWSDWQEWHRTHPRRSLTQFLDNKNDWDWYVGAIRKVGEVKSK